MKFDCENTLKIKWSKREHDLLCYYPRRCDMALFFNWLGNARYNPISKKWDKSFRQELEERGYDIKTLKFEIKKLQEKKQ